MKGPFAKPAGFKSRAKKELEKRKREAEEQRKELDRIKKLEAQNWWDGLTEDERARYRKKSRVFPGSGPALEAHILKLYKENTTETH